jgi:SAM-dependent methyltransferase
LGHGSAGAGTNVQGLDEIKGVQAAIDGFMVNMDSVRVLEAGCGSLSRINLGDHAYVVGLDVSEAMLEKNTMLDEKILGDVEAYEFPEASFDVIVCWYVFEHLPHPERAMARFAHAIRPGGLIILALPNVKSLKGLITKYTPFRFHVWVRRRLLGVPNAGTLGHGPFPTFLPFSLAPDALRQMAESHGLTVLYSAMFEDNQQVKIRNKFKVTGKRWDFIQRWTKRLTGGRLETVKTECLVVLRAAA